LKLSKFKYAGHLGSANPETWNYKFTFWTPYDYKREKERPPIRWVDTPWHKHTHNREYGGRSERTIKKNNL